MAGGFFEKLGLSRKKSVNHLAARDNTALSLNGNAAGGYGYDFSVAGDNISRSSNYPATLNSIPESDTPYQRQTYPSPHSYRDPYPQSLRTPSLNPTPSVRSTASTSTRYSTSTRHSNASISTALTSSTSTSSRHSRSSNPNPNPHPYPNRTINRIIKPPPSIISTASTNPGNPTNPLPIPTADTAAAHAAAAAEVRRAIQLLRVLFELRIRIWATRDAHPRHLAAQDKVKQQAIDLMRDLEGMVEEWGRPGSQSAGVWSDEERVQIDWIRREVRGMGMGVKVGGFWEDGDEAAGDGGREFFTRGRGEGGQGVYELGGR